MTLNLNVIYAQCWTSLKPGVFTTFSVMFVGFYYQRVPDAIQTLVDHSEVVNAFSFSWSAATNVWATSMIAYKAWYVASAFRMVLDAHALLPIRLQRRDLGRYISSTGMAVQNVFTLMVDVGIIYTIFMVSPCRKSRARLCSSDPIVVTVALERHRPDTQPDGQRVLLLRHALHAADHGQSPPLSLCSVQAKFQSF